MHTNRVKKYLRMKKFLVRFAVLGWWHLPFNRQNKERIKGFFFTLLPFLFKHSQTYRNWKYTRSLAKSDFRFKPEDFPLGWPTDPVDVSPFNPESSDNTQKDNSPDTAIIIHAFYSDVFADLLEKIKVLPASGKMKLFISTRSEIRNSIESLLKQQPHPWYLEIFANHGRDILPFIKIAPKAIKEGYDLILKLHTKKSDHRLTGEVWRKELYNRLLTADIFSNMQHLFRQVPRVGIAGPAGHIVPMSLYYGGNARATGWFAYRLGVKPTDLQQLQFVAGSMFYIRSNVLKPLLDMGIDESYFEPEQGQQDGTLAHAYERAFALACHATRHVVVATSSTTEKLEKELTLHHPFTW